MNNFLTATFGPSWRTTIYGFVSKAFLGFILAAVVQPQLIDNALGQHAQAVKSWCVLIWFIIGSAKDWVTADKREVPIVANKEAQEVVDSEVKRSAQVDPGKLPLVILIGFLALFLAGCSLTYNVATKELSGSVDPKEVKAVLLPILH